MSKLLRSEKVAEDSISVDLREFPIFGDAERAEILRNFISPYQSYKIKKMDMVWVADAAAAGPHLICFKDNRIVLDSYRGNKGVRRAPFIVDKAPLYEWDDTQVSTERVETAITIGGKASGEFFHWMIEILPRLTWLREAAWQDKLPILMRPVTKPFQSDTFAALGIRPTETKSDVIYLDKVGFPRHTISYRGSGWISPEVIPLAHIFASKYLKAEPSATGRRIYVSRGDAPKRRIANEGEVVAFLTKLNFEVVELSKLGLKEQATLFAEAGVVIGLHGAGLSSVIFSSPGTKVIELYPERFEAVSPYWNLASLGDLDYRMVLCESVGTGTYHNSDVHVRCSSLALALEDL